MHTAAGGCIFVAKTGQLAAASPQLVFRYILLHAAARVLELKARDNLQIEGTK